MMWRLLLPILFVLLTSKTGAQQFGGFPPQTKWQQINTDTVRIIFEAGAEAQAQQIAAIIHVMAANNPLGKSLKKVHVVLHSKTTEANGYVGLAPFRSEYYLLPGGDIFETGNLPWHKLLAVHEYRHVAQYNAFNKGLTKAFSFVLGEEGRALANAFAVPDWFFEGDAVYAETALTPHGRGRMPYFFKGYESLWNEGKDYSWMKLRNGSIKDFVPNHYPLGYLLVNWGYLKYGHDFWQKVTNDASAFKGLIYPFQKAVKRQTGKSFKSFRKEAFSYYKKRVDASKNTVKKGETVTSYLYPQMIGKDSMLFLKNSYESIPQFTLQIAGVEHKIRQQNISGDDWFSYRKGTIAYTSFNTSARWSLQNYSNIVLLDIATGNEKKLTKKGYYFTPDISPDGEKIIVVSINDSLKTDLHLLTKEGAFLKGFAPPENAVFFQPRFINDSSVVVGLKYQNATLSWDELNINTVLFTSLLPQTGATIGYPYVRDSVFYFTSSAAGSDDIYSLPLSTKGLKRLTSGGTGSYFPSVYNDTLHYSTFTSNGYKLKAAAIGEMPVKQIDQNQMNEPAAPFPVAVALKSNSVFNIAERAFAVTGYKKSSGLINVHSWRPFYEAPEYSFSVYSNNVLNTFLSEAFYRYNEAEQSHTAGLNTSYAGFFTVINAGVTYTADRHLKTPTATRTYNSAEARIGISVPLNVTSGKTYRFFNGGSNFVFNALRPTGETKEIAKASNTTYLHHYLNWSQQLPKAKKQIFPSFGYHLSTAYRHKTSGKGYQSLLSTQVFLPSIFTTHSFVIAANFQQTDTGNVLFSNRFAASRGYNNLYFSRMWRSSANYHFPLFYPDKGVADIVYLLRIRSAMFYDHTRVFSRNKKITNDLRSVGGELFFDTKWWNQLPVSFGLRYSYLLDASKVNIGNPNRFEIILPVNLIPN